MNDLLRETWESTEDLYQRHGLDADTTPPAKRRRFLNEEILELMEASTRNEDYPLDLNNLLEEAADVMVTLCGLLQAHGLELDFFESACRRKLQNNNEKTAANGYSVFNGKISRQRR